MDDIIGYVAFLPFGKRIANAIRDKREIHPNKVYRRGGAAASRFREFGGSQIAKFPERLARTTCRAIRLHGENVVAVYERDGQKQFPDHRAISRVNPPQFAGGGGPDAERFRP